MVSPSININGNGLSLSVFVPVYHCTSTRAFSREDRIKDLVSCITSLKSSFDKNQQETQYRWKQVQIVIIDDYSPIPVSTLLDQQLTQFVTIVRNQGKKGQAGSLNYGLDYVKSDIYATTYSDCVVEQSWLTKIAKDFTDPHSELFGAQGPNWHHQKASTGFTEWITKQETKMIKYIFELHLDPLRERTTRIDCRTFAFKRSAYLDYRESQQEFFVGDIVSGDTSHRLTSYLSQNDLYLQFDPELKVFHQPITSYKKNLIKYYQWGRKGKFLENYTLTYQSLFIAFLRKYFVRQFINPVIKGGVSPLVVWPYHTMFWLGIWKKKWSLS